ncbi:GumC family protein [Shimia sp. MMG029]|uniref:GumC family protein n=1 Tax=Shimia sp. MMG029 TaxID=3021978 RepID=UPI002FDE27B0
MAFQTQNDLSAKAHSGHKVSPSGFEPDGIEIRRLFSAIWRRKLLIVASTLIVSVLFFAAVSRVVPLYTARASLMLDSRSVQVLNSDNVVSDLNLNNPVMDTETAVLRSNLLLERVVQEIGPAALAPIDPALQPPGLLDRLKGQIKSTIGTVLGIDATETVQIAAEDAQTRRLVGAMRRSMTVWREGQSYLIAVSVETPDPELSALIAQTVVDTYIIRQVEMRNDVIRSATAFLTGRIEETRKSVEAAEAKIADFRSEQLAELGISSETVERQLLELSTQLGLAQADLAQIDARYNRIIKVISTDGFERAADLLTTVDLQTSSFVLSLRQRLSEANRREAELATRFSEDYPERAVIRAEIDQLREELAQEVRKTLASLENEAAVAAARVASIRASVVEVEERSSGISRANIEMRQLEREAEALRENYENMLNRLSETRSTELLQRADARRVEKATVPGAPSSPRVMLFTIFGAALGFAIGLIATFVLAVSHIGFATPHEIERALGLPVRASLLQGKLRSRRALFRLLHSAPFSPYLERLRQLRAMLLVLNQNPGSGYCVQVTSSVANESKTSTVISLACLEARAQRRCIVLDFDFRRSSLSRDLRFNAPFDLEDVLQNRCQPEEAIRHSRELGFDLLTLKKASPQLGEQVEVHQVKALIDHLKKTYDLVLIDSAPVLLVADSIKIATLADTVVLLVRQYKTPRKAAIQAARMLNEVGVKSVQVAMTFADRASEQELYGSYSGYNYK